MDFLDLHLFLEPPRLTFLFSLSSCLRRVMSFVAPTVLRLQKSDLRQDISIPEMIHLFLWKHLKFVNSALWQKYRILWTANGAMAGSKY